MPIDREGQFLVQHDGDIAPSLGIESQQLAACIAEARRRPYPGVFGSPGFGFAEDHLDFLTELAHLRRIWFWDVTLRSIDGLYALEALEYCGVLPDTRPGIDFSRLPRLQTLVWQPHRGDCGVAELRALRRLHVWHFNPRERSFATCPVPPQLEELEINWAAPASLDGLPVMPALRRLGVHRCRNLTSLALLPTIAPNLEWLTVQACGRVRGADAVEWAARMPKLRFAFVQDRHVRPPGTPAIQ